MEENIDDIKRLVIYEDNHLLCLNKPSGMPTVPDASGDISLLDLGKRYLKITRKKPGNCFLAVVHRLDRPVSGLICFAITSKAARRLSKELREGRFEKSYFCVTDHASPVLSKKRKGIIKTFLKKDRKRNVSRISRKGEKGAKLAITQWELKGERDGLFLYALRPITGRAHQLRVHMAKVLKAPILGDLKYGSTKKVLSGRAIALHAKRLKFSHPTRREVMVFTAPLPDYFPFGILG